MPCTLETETIMPEDRLSATSLELAVEVVVAWLSNPNTSAHAGDISALLNRVHAALTERSASADASGLSEAEPVFTPAVSVRRSLASEDHLISMIDGKPYRALKRHLTRHGLTPAQYRERYGLKPDYPMVSESYSQLRRELALKRRVIRQPDETVAPADTSRDRKESPAARSIGAAQAAASQFDAMPPAPASGSGAAARAELAVPQSAHGPERATQLRLMEAIARKRLVHARYNGALIRLAPHLLFERRGDLFVSALNVDKVWRSGEYPRLGQFKLAGLHAPQLADKPFDPLPGFDRAPPRAEDVVLLSV